MRITAPDVSRAETAGKDRGSPNSRVIRRFGRRSSDQKMGVVGIDRDEDTDDDHRVNGSIPDLSLRSWVDAYNVGERRWMEAQIVDAYEDRVLLHYKGFRPALDEWVERSSPRIRPFHSYTPARTGASHSQDWCVGHRLMVLDSREMWLTAEIVEVNSTMVKVHYSNMHERYDEWINKDSYRLAELDTDAEALCMIREGVPSSGNSLSGENRALFRATLQDEENFRNLMWTRLNARIVEMDYDGNCLFRAVSHQVYGDPSHHFQVRTFCCSYMEREREFFSNYSTESDFASYLRRMRRAGEWGDHLEIQAMSEIYERPILVYAYSAEPMRTYSNQKTVSNPIRISYHFESHYNSVVVAGSPVVPPPLFYMEQKALTRTSARTQELVNNLAERIDSMEIEKAINESLTNLLEAECKNQSLLEMDAGNDLQAAIEESRKQKEDEEAAMLQSAIALSSADTLLDLPYPIRHCHVELQFPLKDCIDAYTAIRSLSNSDDVDIEHMTDWILNHSFA